MKGIIKEDLNGASDRREVWCIYTIPTTTLIACALSLSHQHRPSPLDPNFINQTALLFPSFFFLYLFYQLFVIIYLTY